MSNVLLGTAIGDALGVPFETMDQNNPLLLNWDLKSYLGSEHHNLKPAQYSDDTQMSLMVAESLIENKGFKPKDLSARYVDWIMSNRARGYGRTTAIAVKRLHAGIHWTKSGVKDSYGNGTAMRAAPFGVYFKDDLKALIKAVKIDSAITHDSPEAEAGALTIALAVYFIVNDNADDLINKILPYLPKSNVKDKLPRLIQLVGLPNGLSKLVAVNTIGTDPDVRQTVPAALFCFLVCNNYYDGVITSIMAGGDTDTTAAIVGALFGAKVGIAGIDNIFHTVEDFDKLVSLDNMLLNKSK